MLFFRVHQHQNLVSTDIERTFLQVGVIEIIQPSLLLWPEDKATNVAAFKCHRLFSGSNDSPTYANYALQRTASDKRVEHLKAARSVQKSF